MEERFWSKVDVRGPDDCWLWMAAQHTKQRGQHVYGPYGYFYAGKRPDGRKRTMEAHRWVYQSVYGALPRDIAVDHKCCNTLCVNPAHLREATNKQNAENRRSAQITSVSGIRGVSLWHGYWRAQVKHNGHVWVRYCKSEEEAQAAVIAKRLELFTHNEVDRRQRV